MTLQVIGAGFGRTGTNSLKLALEQLGFGPCHHMFEVRDHPEQNRFWQAAADGDLPDWDEVFEGYNSSIDWPSAHFWRELSEHYPNAKVLLSVRDPEKWFKSVHSTIYPVMVGWKDRELEADRDRGRMAHQLIVEGRFGGRMDDKDHAIGIFNTHIEEVQRKIAPERLLTYDVAEGWGPLCAFLGVAVPETPFPRSNSTEEFNRDSKED